MPHRPSPTPPALSATSVGPHEEHCDVAMCCRCQSRRWATYVGAERLCGLCASCCVGCGRLPSRHLGGLPDGLCATCRGRCRRCARALDRDAREREEAECGRCRKPPARPGRDPVGFVLRALPRPLLSALGGRLPPVVVRTVQDELARRSPQQLFDRIERRWYGRWSHALGETDEETGLPRWTPEDLACRLVARGSCTVAGCEDGVLIESDQVCPACHRRGPRFVYSVPPSSARTREQALTAMRGVLSESPHRTGAAARRRAARRAASDERRPEETRRGRRAPEAQGGRRTPGGGAEAATERARDRTAGPDRPRPTPPPPPGHPGTRPVPRPRSGREAGDEDRAQESTGQAVVRNPRSGREEENEDGPQESAGRAVRTRVWVEARRVPGPG
ncbi:hypothetical protein [Streptomyces sp. NPDC003077]|uniref:hypothetical protein n=1 Tax=Streptomyces sp. NPDC003077 TaxID=3154443 RepID=UPI0033AB5A39